MRKQYRKTLFFRKRANFPCSFHLTHCSYFADTILHPKSIFVKSFIKIKRIFLQKRSYSDTIKNEFMPKKEGNENERKYMYHKK